MKDQFRLPFLQFAALVLYIILQLVWWAWLIRDLNREVHDLTILHLQDSFTLNPQRKIEIDHKLAMRNMMIVGEGLVFMLILFLGIWQIFKALKRERKLISLQNNFLMAVSHELKSPVTAIRLQIETLLRKEQSREMEVALLDYALEETNRLTGMIENVLMANRLEQHAYSPEIQPVDLNQECLRCIQLFSKGGYQDRRIAFSPIGNLIFPTDVTAFRSILDNLVENALKYSPADKAVEIKLKYDQSFVEMMVQDFGQGIPIQEQELIFRKFYRAGNEETRKSKGSGLGLFIVANLVTILKGEIKVHSSVREGTTFVVRLPVLSKLLD